MSHENFLKRGYQRSYGLKQVDDSEVVIWKCNENVMSFSNHSSLFQVISAKYVIPILGFDCILSLFWVRDKRAGKYTRARETRRTAPIRKERRIFGKFIFCKVVTFSLPSSSSCLFVWFFFFFYFVLSVVISVHTTGGSCAKLFQGASVSFVCLVDLLVTVQLSVNFQNIWMQ